MTLLFVLTCVISLWLIVAGVVMALRPAYALTVVAKAGSTVGLQWLEHTLRFLAGVVLVLVAPESRAPQALLVIGGFIAATSILILMLPRRWHHAYAAWCARALPPWLVRLLSPVSVIAAGALLWAVI
jgi:hypothetical protein